MTQDSSAGGPGARLRALRQSFSTGGGRAESLGCLFEALLEAGVPALIVLVALLYSPQLSDTRIGKLAAIHLMGGLLAGLWLGRAALQGQLRLEHTPLYRPMLIYLGVSLAALALAHNRAQGAEALLTQTWLFLLCLLALHHFRDPAAISRVLWTAVLAGLVVAGLGVLQYNGIHLIPLPQAYGNLPISTLGNPNFVAHYLEIVIPLILALLAVRRRWWEQALLWLALALTGAHLVISGSRAGWLALVVALVFWFWSRLSIPARWLHQALLWAVVAALLSAPLGLVLDSIHLGEGKSLHTSFSQLADNTWERALSGFDPHEFSVAQRLIIWGDTLDLIGDHWLLGVGPGNFELSLPAYRTPERHRAWKQLMGERTHVAYEAENEYLEFWAESGVLGLAAMVWLLGAMVWNGLRCLGRQGQPELRALTRGCLAGLIATLVHSCFSFNLQDPASAAHFWLLGGMAAALNRPEGGGPVLSLHSAGRRAAALAAGAVLVLAGAYTGLCLIAGDYYYFKGRWHQLAGHPNRATLALVEGIGWRGWDFRYPHSLGLVHLETGRHAEAEAALRHSLELHPNNAPALRLLGQALYWQRKPDQAAAALERAAALDPLNFQSHAWLARAYQQQQDPARAIASWERALTLQPQDPEVLVSLGIAHREAGQLPQAIERLEQAARLQPQAPLVMGNLGAVYLLAGRLAEAEELLKRTIAADPQQSGWRRNLALALAQQNRLEEALAQAEAFLRSVPQDEQVQRLARHLRQRLDEEGP